MLEQSLTPNVVDFDASVGARRSDASAIRMEQYLAYSILMISVCVDKAFLGYIPEFDSLIIRPRHDKPRVRRKLG